MKIEAEVHNSLYSFTSVESGKYGVGGEGGTGCSGTEPLPPPSAQDNERSSIGRPERQLTPPGCGSNNPSPAQNQNNGTHVQNSTPLTSVFDCEHFQFIDEEETEENGAEETPMAALANGTTCSGNGTAPVNGFHREDDSEVSSLPCTCGGDDSMSSGVDSKTAKEGRGTAMKRQVSFDDATTGGKGLKSLLKKQNRKVVSKRRVTFDEAVTLYSDEHESVRYLALTTGPDIICAEYYMFEPPIEYQDVPPFEPPAEYRDDTEKEPSDPPLPAESLPEKKTSEDNDLQNSISSEPNSNDSVAVGDEENINKPAAPPSEEPVPNNTPGDENNVHPSEEMEIRQTDSNQILDPTRESDKLFERFLEAEREFAIDEELNNVFHELDSDFVNDGRNGALDDNFFRKLITLLTSAEGDTPLEDGDFFSSTKFANSGEYTCTENEEDENSQAHSRTLSEADSDCSISSQDTIIVRLGEEDNETDNAIHNNEELNGPHNIELVRESSLEKSAEDSLEQQRNGDEVFNGTTAEIPIDDKPQPFPRESLVMKNIQLYQAAIKDKANEESLSRQSSGEQSVNSANSSGNSQDHPADADDSTSSDSRSGEVEEEIRLDDIGYDEEDADDYDEESFRGMARGNSKIRRIIKKNALQCTLFKGIEAKRRQQPGAKYPRPKSPLLSQESLVEKLKWLTTVDDQKDPECQVNFHSKPPDVILSTGTIPLNNPSENDIHKQMALSYQQQQQFYQMQRFAMAPNNKGGYYVRHENYHPSLPRQRMAGPGHPSQMSTHNVAYQQGHMVAHQGAPPTAQWSEQQRNMTVPRNFRDWRVIQRVVNRNADGGARSPQIPSDYVRCSTSKTVSYPPNVPPDVSRTLQQATRGNKDELEQFVEQDSKRTEKLRKRYSMAEEDDPTFGFARRPSVRGVQSRIELNPSDPSILGYATNKADFNPYAFDESGQPVMHGGRPASYSAEPVRAWSRDPNWRPENGPYGPGRSQAPMHIHRASVALTELPGNATIPYVHRKPNPDPRYHSYVESMYGSTWTLPTPTKGWDPRTCHNVPNPGPSPKMLQVPLHPVATKDERGVPEGASSSPKLSSDSLYNSPVPDTGGPHKDGMIYYSLNV